MSTATAIAERDTTEPERTGAVVPADPMALLDKAVTSGADIATLEKLMALQERWEANHARRAFDTAVAKAKAEIPVIDANRSGHNQKRYADMAAIARVVDPILSKHGLSYRFRTEQTDRIAVTCILSHEAGHSEATTLAGNADKTGSKNDIQAIGSTLTYLQRYSLKQALGLAASDDDDGAKSGDGVISDEQFAELQKIIDDNGFDVPKFCEFMKVGALADIPANQFRRAKQALLDRAKQAAGQ